MSQIVETDTSPSITDIDDIITEDDEPVGSILVEKQQRLLALSLKQLPLK